MFQSVCCNPDADLDDVCLTYPLGTVKAPNAIFAADPVSGSSFPDDNWTEEGLSQSRSVHHGKHLVNAANTQTPIPMEIGGGTPYGPIPKAPAMMGMGGDTVTQVYRSQRYPAIARIHPESTGTVGSVASSVTNFT